jgi:hypothetical protein
MKPYLWRVFKEHILMPKAKTPCNYIPKYIKPEGIYIYNTISKSNSAYGIANPGLTIKFR